MNIILGASGQVGSAIVDFLVTKNVPVKGVIRNPDKAEKLREKGAAVSIADYFDLQALASALKEGETVFVLTPESPASKNVIGDTKNLVENYRSAIQSSQIKKVIGLSSLGAQHASGTGNLQMSYLLEHAFQDLNIQQIFIRPAYYYSNWLPYISTAKDQGILPTFFPVDLKIPMISPIDVAEFIAGIIVDDTEESQIYELLGPEDYSSNDVAFILSGLLNREVKTHQIPETAWEETIRQFGFTEDAARNLIEMIEAVIDGKTRPEQGRTEVIRLSASLKDYLTKHANS